MNLDAPSDGNCKLKTLLLATIFAFVPTGFLWAAQAFQESSGLVVIEAEHFDNKLPRNGKDWVLETAQSGYSGSGYTSALPNTGTSITTGYATTSPELVYNVFFSTTGTYYVWMRGTGPTSYDDIVNIGIDGSAPSSGNKIGIFPSSWTWSKSRIGGYTTLIVSTTGLHTIHIWMAEDGFRVDKFLLRLSQIEVTSPAPTGIGPAESSRINVGSDTTAPTVSITTPSNGATVSGTISVDATASDDVGVVGVQFKLDGANLGAEDTTSPYSISWDTTTTSNATHSLSAIARDAAGNNTTSNTVNVTVNNALSDTTAPTGSVTINANAQSTNSATVTLSLLATDNSGSVTQMQFSNDGATYSAAEAYATIKSWTLSAGNGTKTVYAKFKDAAGNWSNAATDTIILDTTPPVISAVSSSNITSSSATITWATNEGATSQVEYGTTTSYGLTSMLDTSVVTNHSVSLPNLSAATLYHYRVRSKDTLSNESISVDYTFTTSLPPDTAAPSGSIIINGNSEATNNPTVTLTISATDNSGVVSRMRFSNDGVTYAPEEAYSTTKSWPLLGADGTKTVYVQFADSANNWSSAASDTIVLDTTAPVLTITEPLDGAVIIAPIQ